MLQWSEVKWKSVSHVWLFVIPYSLWNSPGQNTGVDSLSLLLGIFSTQGSNPGLPHCRGILYQLSHKILEILQPKNTGVSSLLQGIFPPQKLNQGLLYCRLILCQLSCQGSQTLKTSGYLHFHLQSLAPFSVFQMATTLSALNPNWKCPGTALSNRTFCNNRNTPCLHCPIWQPMSDWHETSVTEELNF